MRRDAWAFLLTNALEVDLDTDTQKQTHHKQNRAKNGFKT